LPGIKIVKGLVSGAAISACTFLLLTHLLILLLQALAVQFSELANKFVDFADSINAKTKNIFMLINLFF
jgi:hypothetical protein